MTLRVVRNCPAHTSPTAGVAKLSSEPVLCGVLTALITFDEPQLKETRHNRNR